MNADDVDRMEAGREMDCEVAMTVLKWQGIMPRAPHAMPDSRTGRRADGLLCQVPKFSTEIAAAWEVLSHFIDSMPGIHVSRRRDEWHVQLFGGCLTKTYEASSPSEMLSICRAALKAALASSREPGKVETGRKE